MLPKWAENKQKNQDFNGKDSNGWTGLHWACKKGPLKIVELLLKEAIKFNINLNIVDNKGYCDFTF